MDAQPLGQLAAGLQPVADLDRAGHDSLANLVADLSVKGFLETGIKRQDHGTAPFGFALASPIYEVKSYKSRAN